MVIIWGVSLKMVELILLYGGAKFESYKGKLNVVLATRIAIPWIIGLNQAHVFTKRFIKSS